MNSVKTKHSTSSPVNKEIKKQKEGNTYMCPICMDVIKEADNTNDGHGAIFVKVLVTHGYTISVQANLNLILTCYITLRYLLLLSLLPSKIQISVIRL